MSMFDNIGSNLSLCDGDDDLASEDDLSVFDGFPAGLRSKSRVLLAPVLGIRDIIDSNSFSPMDDLTPIPNAVIEYTTYNRDRFSTRHQVPVSPAADLSLKHPSVSPGPDSINRYSSRDAAPVVKRLPSCAVRPKKKTELPLEIRGSTYAACPDSGSHENIMVHDLALKLGLLVDVSPEHQKEFRLGNGKIVKSLGQATVACSFAKETGVEYACTFYIFQTLIKSIIIGMAFLDATETLTKYKHRLHSMMVPRNGPLQFCVLNNPAQRLHCRVDGKPLLASADTGCEIDLISLAYAKKRLFTFGDELRSSIRQGELRSLMMGKVGMRDSKVQLADGSEAFLEGKVNIDIIIGKKDSSSVDEKALVTRRTFYVLKGLTSDMVLGDEFLDETDAFVTYKAALESDTSEDALSQVNTIVWLKTPERFLGHLFGAHQQAAPEPLDSVCPCECHV